MATSLALPNPLVSHKYQKYPCPEKLDMGNVQGLQAYKRGLLDEESIVDGDVRKDLPALAISP